MKLVGLVGAAGCGKSTVADILTAYGYSRLKFSQPLKDMLKSLGLTNEHTEGKLKEVPCDLLSGRTPRYAMQTLGTEWARDIMAKDFWLNIWRDKVLSMGKVVAEDCRFKNESELIKSLGGELWVIKRPGYELSGHSSETEMGGIKGDYTIHNHGNEADLKMMIYGILNKPKWEGDAAENKICIEKKQYVT
jgi:ABC-type dipeptide/oligopeptide/nickel transport system ATPase subunit